MRPLFAVSCFSLFALLAHAAPAAAAAPASCQDQIAALCPDSEPNSPERRDCVRKASDKLTPDCQAKLAHSKPAAKPAGTTPFLQPLVDACADDQPRIQKLCTDSTKLLGCLQQHRSEFSSACQSMIDRYSAAQPAQTPAKKP